jgi:biotin carboxylase
LIKEFMKVYDLARISWYNGTMPDHQDNKLRRDLPKRVLLLLTQRTYRARSFIDAAERLDIEIHKAINMQKELAEYWDYPLGLEYSDLSGAVKAIMDFDKHKPLGAILAVDDSGSLLAAETSKILSLPHNSPEAAVAARNKYKMRQALHQANVPAPQSTLYHFAEEPRLDQIGEISEKVSYPCVLKPLNLSGSRGVIRADDPASFASAAEQLHSLLIKHQTEPGPIPFIVEKYIPGKEVALEGILVGGNLKVLALFDKPDPLEGPYFEETIYVTPSRLSADVQSSVLECVAQATSALGLQEGPVHAELRLNNDGPWIIELAGRSIGGLCSQTLRFGPDISLEELILRNAFGMPIQTFEREDLAGGVMMIPIPSAGLLKEINGCEAALTVPLIESIEITAKINYSLTPLPEGDSYLGFIFARGNSPDAVEAALRKAHKQLSFVIAPELPLQSHF